MRVNRLPLYALLMIGWFLTLQPAVADEVTLTPMPYDIVGDPDFPNLRQVLVKLIASKKKAAAVNRFCVVGYKSMTGDGYKDALVYWPQDNAIILWEPTNEPVADLRLSKRYLHLDKDITADGAPEAVGSDYLEPMSWLAVTLQDCVKRGSVLTLEHGVMFNVKDTLKTKPLY